MHAFKYKGILQKQKSGRNIHKEPAKLKKNKAPTKHYEIKIPPKIPWSLLCCNFHLLLGLEAAQFGSLVRLLWR